MSDCKVEIKLEPKGNCKLHEIKIEPATDIPINNYDPNDDETYFNGIVCKKEFPILDVQVKTENCFLSEPEDLKTNYNEDTKVLYTNQDIKLENQVVAKPIIKYQCDLCGKYYAQRSVLNKHKQVHRNEHMTACKICGNIYKKAYIYRHMKSHTEDPTTAPKESYKCEVCNKTYAQKSSWYRHRKEHSGQVVEKKVNEKYPCDICGNTYTRKNSLNKHKLVHKNLHKTTCKICGKIFRKSYIYEHMRYHKDAKIYQCNMCGKRYLKKCRLLNHENEHSKRIQYKCEVCGKEYHNKDTYTSHLWKHKENKCDLCFQGFISKAQCDEHRKTCNKLSPSCNQACHICEKEFTSLQFIKHMSTHLNDARTFPKKERGHKCNICNKTFARINILKQHMIVHSGAKTFDCNICKKRFRQISQLKQHALSHSDLKLCKCNFCGKQFKYRSKMLQHKRTHEECREERVCTKVKIEEVNPENIAMIYIKPEMGEVDCGEETIIMSS